MAIGAHYDHLGRGGAGNSLADKDQANQIHHGADDNASGTAAVLAIAEAISKQPRNRNLLIAFWSGEELGLLGSNAFVNKPPVATDQLAAYLNFDHMASLQPQIRRQNTRVAGLIVNDYEVWDIVARRLQLRVTGRR